MSPVYHSRLWGQFVSAVISLHGQVRLDQYTTLNRGPRLAKPNACQMHQNNSACLKSFFLKDLAGKPWSWSLSLQE